MPSEKGEPLGLRDRLLGRRQPVLEAIFLAPAAGRPMAEGTAVRVEAGGLAGDRYAVGEGFWHGPDACAVTLIRGEDLDRIQRRTGLPLSAGEHRRNLVVRGLRPQSGSGGLIGIGEAVLAVAGPRPPCGYLEQLTRPGMARALRGRSGLCMRVVQPGRLQVGDPVRWIDGAGAGFEAPPTR